ncbi:unnamed protein product [Clonostachys rhizophaga]|uniref:FAD/NAD(P)-binding domain-containing protein n=1 Tax=Clonostachys rhizophaga TaxID=160324 RepID=A0A9N9VXC5_9HYPO|nr:unnamed protein product [Clonostachys rhizophaga]
MTDTSRNGWKETSSSDLKNPNLVNGDLIAAVRQKYDEERNKRIRDDGMAQFVDLYDHEKFRHFKADPWVELEPPRVGGPNPPQEGSNCDILIVGTGYGGLLFAVRLLEAGFKLENIRLVDSAAGFGGTWYWNRYPGLMCDVESYIYMPLLEETGYIPTMKYTSSQELRDHAERIAKKWNLDKITWFKHRVQSIEWDDATNEWVTSLVPQLQHGNEGKAISVRSRFSILATGFTLIPRVAQIPGIGKFKGSYFHTARWDYNVTGGTPKNPEMAKLKDKRVGIIGTGATAIQVVPALAAWAKELYVFQRTPSAVDRRDNRPTDPDWANAMRSTPGWQTERIENFQSFISNDPTRPSTDMVSDGWTRMASYSALGGSPGLVCQTSEEIQKHVEVLHALDFPRQESIRKRVDELVSNSDTAQKLKPWYPGWCKRPCFHDEYLQSFNRPNVKLVDTDGRGVDRITEDSLIVGNQEYKVDTLILGTGYRSPVLFSPAGRVGLDVKGRNGRSLDKKWTEGVTTLHGMMSHDFPNLFWPGLNQSGAGPNFTYCIDMAAIHISKVMVHAAGIRAGHPGGAYHLNFVIEPTPDAEEEWSQRVASTAGVFAASAGCTPSYFNAEGEFIREVPEEVQKKRARSAIWSQGPVHFRGLLEDWRENKNFEGLSIVALESKV